MLPRLRLEPLTEFPYHQERIDDQCAVVDDAGNELSLCGVLAFDKHATPQLADVHVVAVYLTKQVFLALLDVVECGIGAGQMIFHRQITRFNVISSRAVWPDSGPDGALSTGGRGC